ncbi:hypothetical protein HLB23_35680 [Nocardia uniformis]|uniref:Lipoprotein LpqS n=2 Tax=Nocardia uniformis TaxID=53432 RepID=A0A849C901_9NOCA|nr:hypothetical protein [Nocardia uniformis]NNH75134.1 hypothetical protein [Nocardia uniformis]
MNLVGRLRYAKSALAVLATALLLTMLADCMLVSSPSHPHATPHSVSALDLVAGPGHPHFFVDRAHCEPSGEHCEKSVLLSQFGGPPYQPTPLLSLLVVLLAAAVLWLIAGGVRGPPTSPAVVSGRLLLTRFCIARR